MLLRIMSDLHMEFGDFDLPELETDKDTVLILAGDTNVGIKSQEWIYSIASRFRNVIFINGNHEYYKNDIFDVDNDMDVFTHDLGNICFLQNNVLLLENTMFIGTTLWTDMNKSDKAVIYQAWTRMNDYGCISLANKMLAPQDTIRMNGYSVEWLNGIRDVHKDWRKVLITHHLPTYKSISKTIGDRQLDPCYASDLDDLVEKLNPVVAIHGHTHESKDYMLGNTRIVCNPRGYIGYEVNKDFDPNLVIEI